MKIGLTNLLKDNIINLDSVPDADIGFDNINLIDPDTLKVWQATGTNINFQFTTTPITLDVICLFNVDFTGVLTLRTYENEGGVMTNECVFTDADLKGLDYKHLLCELTDKTTEITYIDINIANTAIYTQGYMYNSVIFNSVMYGPTVYTSTPVSIGYVWGGKVVDMGCSESIQPFDISADDVRIVRANITDIQERFNYQTYNVTSKKFDSFQDLRTKIRSFIATGYATPRPFIIDDNILDEDEVVYGIFDSPRFGYDIIETSTTKMGQITYGIREVF